VPVPEQPASDETNRCKARARMSFRDNNHAWFFLSHIGYRHILDWSLASAYWA
jgi:hypothetical protein